MKKIALIMEDEKRIFTFARINGMLERIREKGRDVTLYIFRSAGARSMDLAYNVGEYNIYRLPDFSEFDGIILDLNSVYQRESEWYGDDACTRVIERARQSGKPIISIANRIEGFYFAGIDNYKAMMEIAAHVYNIHRCRKYWFLMGPEDNYENQLRTRAIKDYLGSRGVDCSESYFYFESYECNCGYKGFIKLLKEHGGVPEAVICANDNIAIGACKAAEEMGYDVPRDFLVTGFDNYDKAAYFQPRISTVDQKRKEVGCKCMDIFFDIWDGKKVPEVNYTGTENFFWDSCGCTHESKVDLAVYTKAQIYDQIEKMNFDVEIKTFEYELLHCNNIKEICGILPRYIPNLKCNAMYLVLDKRIYNVKREIDYYKYYKGGFTEEEDLCTEGYSDDMCLVFAYENGNIVDIDSIDKEVWKRLTALESRGQDFLFVPLHFRQYAVGYLVASSSLYMIEKQYIGKFIMTLATGMENLHRKQRMEYINRVLSGLYMQDAMTGIYNRLGYQNLVCRVFDEKRKNRENLSILYLDMDKLKYINDHFGHEYGDFAIKTIADVLREICPRDALLVRLGGDEFLAILEQRNGKEMRRLIKTIREELAQRAKNMQLPCELTVSIGWLDTDMESGMELDEYVRRADSIMYEEKSAKKML